MNLGRVILCAAAVVGISALGCSGDSSNKKTLDGGPGGAGTGGAPPAGTGGSTTPIGTGGSGSGGTGATGGTGGGGTGGATEPPAVVCGTTTCPAIDTNAAMMGVSACCRPDDSCGIMTMLTSSECLPLDAPGGVDLSCPGLTGTVEWFGCCTPSGECGALDSSGALGCIPNSSLMLAPKSCTYDPNNTCTGIVDVQCDGPEDCTGGQQCCGHFSQQGYREFVCADDCAAEEQAGTFVASSQICHPGDTCATTGYSCRQNTDYLPDYLFRCRDTGIDPVRTDLNTQKGKINCGDSVCGSGQKCCVSDPGLPRCIGKDEVCVCTPECSDTDGGVCALDAGI